MVLASCNNTMPKKNKGLKVEKLKAVTKLGL